MSVILSQIQAALQGMGERLEEGPTLLSYTGRMNGSMCEDYKAGGVVWFLYIEVVLYISDDSNVQPSFGSPGEQHFLFGSYSESAQAWRAELWAERERGEKDSLVDMFGFGGQFESKGVTTCSPDGPRSAFLETRLLLSLLYGLLFQYRLKEAQGLGDHMARLLLHQAGPHEDDSAHNAGVWILVNPGSLEEITPPPPKKK